MMDNLLLITVFITILSSPIIYFVGKSIGKQVGYLVAAIMGIWLLVAIIKKGRL